MYRIVAITVLATLGTAAVSAQPVLQLKARQTSSKGQRLSAAAEPKSLTPSRRHQVVQFTEVPTAEDLAVLVNQGAVMLQYVPDNAVLINVPVEFQLSAANVAAAAPLTADNKVSPDLTEETKLVVVEFYPDVEAAQARQIVTIEGLRIAEHADLVGNNLVVEANLEQLKSLAVWDEVAYVYPASEALAKAEPVQPCAGAVTELGSVGQYVARIGEGWDGNGLGSARLRYVFSGLTGKLPADAVRAEILRALAVWSKVVKVDFVAGTDPRGRSTINIMFAAGAHGDAYSFDGRGRTLAHTFYPAAPNPEPLAGDMHFDEAEPWNIGNDIDVFSVALHEMGHALGLGHSDKPGTVMYPYYRRANELSADDIFAIRTLYAERTEETTTEQAAPAPAAPAPSPAPAPAPTPSTPAKPATPAPANPTTPANGTDKAAPVVVIASASSVQTTATSIVLKGTATDNVGVASVTFTSNVYGTKAATGTAQWSATVQLAVGQNTIVVRAFDAAGNSSFRSVVVTRK